MILYVHCIGWRINTTGIVILLAYVYYGYSSLIASIYKVTGSKKLKMNNKKREMRRTSYRTDREIYRYNQSKYRIYMYVKTVGHYMYKYLLIEGIWLCKVNVARKRTSSSASRGSILDLCECWRLGVKYWCTSRNLFPIWLNYPDEHGFHFVCLWM